MILKMTQHPEHYLQKSFFDWLKKCHPKWRPYFFAIPNGGHRHIAVAKYLKAEGVTAGVWDVFCMIPVGSYKGLWIEFKVDKNKLTTEQKAFGERAIERGYQTLICYNIDDAMEWTEKYILGEPISIDLGSMYTIA